MKEVATFHWESKKMSEDHTFFLPRTRNTALAKHVAPPHGILNYTIPEIENLPVDRLEELLSEGLRLSSDVLLRMGKVVVVLESRGKNLDHLKLDLLPIMRKIGAGLLHPEIVVRYSGIERGKLLDRLERLPMQEQQRIVNDPEVTLLFENNDATKQPISEITARWYEQLFAPDHVRTVEEQRRWKRMQIKHKRDRKNVPIRTYRVKIEKDGTVKMGNSAASVDEVRAVLAEFKGPLLEIKEVAPKVQRHIMSFEVTEEERAAILAAAKARKVSYPEFIRLMLHGMGVI
jgi:hypothetical protein